MLGEVAVRGSQAGRGFKTQVSHGGYGAHGGRVAGPRPRAAPWTAEVLLRSATSAGPQRKPRRSADFTDCADGTEGEPQMSPMSSRKPRVARGEPKKRILNIEQGMTNAQVRNPRTFVIGTSLLDIGYSSPLPPQGAEAVTFSAARRKRVSHQRFPTSDGTTNRTKITKSTGSHPVETG